MAFARVVVEVAPDHLDRPFDYRIPDDVEVTVGQRVEVVFAGRKVRGLVVGVVDQTDVPEARVRDLRRTLGDHVWATPDEIEVLRWAAERFAAPVADVVRHALPDRIIDVERRMGEATRPPDPTAPEVEWGPYGDALVGAVSGGGTVGGERAGGGDRAVGGGSDGGPSRGRASGSGAGAFYWRPLPGEDLGARLVELAGLALAGGRDVLVVVGEPVSAAADALVAAYPELAVDVRGDVSPRLTYKAWLRTRLGGARLVVGERKVAFWPLERLGLAVVVDEANPALKERRSPRHHGREVVLERARRVGAVAVLTGTVPSAAAWRLLAERRLTPVVPDRRRERAAAPTVVVDDRSVGTGPEGEVVAHHDPRSRGRLGTPALEALRDAVVSGRYGVVLAARRGEGRAIVCTSCGERLTCPVCDSSLRADGVCEGCGWHPDGPLRCPRCAGDRFAPLAAGAERLGAELSRTLRDTEVDVLEGYAQPAPPPPAVLVMTRGSAHLDPPGPVGAVVLPDLDGMLRRPTLDAAEDGLRLAMRLAAWVSNGGVVVVQTREPGHHAIRALVGWDPGGFWRAEVAMRAELRFPPAATAIRIEVGGGSDGAPLTNATAVAEDLRGALPPGDLVLGPLPTGSRAGLLVKSDDRPATLAALAPLRTAWSKDGRDVRIDVDPVDVT